MPADVYVLGYLAPVIAFLLVVLVLVAVLLKTEILGESKWLNVFVSLAVASLFVSAAGSRDYVLTVVPWFGALIVSVFILLFLLGFVGGKDEDLKGIHGGLRIGVVIASTLIFLVSAFVVFSDSLYSYLPGPGFGSGGDIKLIFFLDWLYSSRVIGAAILLVVSALVSWVVVREGNKK
tara:strand:- start:52 stop:585 length:534 start_codon:yes stop_codon:yes gene_type:complete